MLEQNEYEELAKPEEYPTLEAQEESALMDDIDEFEDDSDETNIATRTIGWLGRHLIFCAYTVLLFLGSILWHYGYVSTEQELSKVSSSVKDAQKKNLFISAKRIEHERLVSVEKNIEEMNLPLVHSTTPPFMIVDKANKEE